MCVAACFSAHDHADGICKIKASLTSRTAPFARAIAARQGSAPRLPLPGLSGTLGACLYVFFRPVTMPMQTHAALLQPRHQRLLPQGRGKAFRRPSGFRGWCALCPCAAGLGVAGAAACVLCAMRRPACLRRWTFFPPRSWRLAGVWPVAVRCQTLTRLRRALLRLILSCRRRILFCQRERKRQGVCPVAARRGRFCPQ